MKIPPMPLSQRNKFRKKVAQTCHDFQLNRVKHLNPIREQKLYPYN